VREAIPLLAVLLLSAAAVFLVFVAGRSVVDRRAARRRAEHPEEVSLLSAVEPAEPTTLPGRIDRGFDELIGETGLGISTAQALGVIALGAVIGAGLPLLLRGDLLLAAVGLLLGVLLPMAYFAFHRSRYRQSIQDQLPDAVFLLSRSLKSGMNLEGSLRTASEFGTQPLAGEFKRVTDRIKLGLHPAAALDGMARRLRMTDFNILVTAVTLHRQVGGNLAHLLERVAAAIRDRNLFRGYFRAATALARVTGFAVAAAPVVLLVGYALWQPDFIDRFTTSALGVRLLVIALVLEIIGIIWMALLLRNDY
jgi:tight adherence protein B